MLSELLLMCFSNFRKLPRAVPGAPLTATKVGISLQVHASYLTERLSLARREFLSSY
jgi:hypothetical protein